MRRKLYTGRARAANDRGGNEIPAAELAQLWSCFLDEELKLARSKLCLADVQDMLERGETPRFNTLVPRTVSGEELANISEWCDKYRAQLVADLGAPLGSVQNTLAGQASANHLENVDLQEQMRAELKAQICQLAPAATKRLVVNRHAFVTVDEGVAKYFLEDGGVWACCDAAPVEGRKYCKLVYVEQQKIGEPGVYYCAGQGTHKAGELHNWSTLVRVKTAEACIKPALPKSLHAIGGQKAKVVSEDGDTLRVKAPLFGDKTFSVRRDFVEFLPPDTEMPPPAERPRAKVRKTAEPAPAPAAPHPPAAGEDCFDERATAFDERAAASDTASHGTVAAPATAEPADSGAAKRSRKEEPTSSKVLLRKLLPRWADALAKGEKLVEFVSYTTGQRNAMKRFTAGTVMVVSTSGSRSVAAVAVAAGQAVVRQRAQDISAALDLVPVSLRAGVQEYLSGKATFDYVVFSHCYDLRPLGVQLEQFYDRFDIAAPRCLSGFPALESSSPGLAERVLQWCWDLGAEQHCRANSIAPSPANKQHQPGSGAPKVPGSRSPQQVGPRDLEAPATPVKSQPTASQCTQDSQFTQNEPSECSSPGLSDDDFKYSFKDATRRRSDRPATDPKKRNGRPRRGRDADAPNSTRQKKSER
jgi:hypothetical protein